MTMLLAVPDDGPWFDGHFPGRPILPGIATLALVAEAVRRAPVRAIAHARFRSTIVPGERLALEARPAGDDTVRVALRREEALVMSATLAFGEPAPAPMSALHPGAPCDAPPLDLLLPHRAPMRFVTAVLDARADGAACAARVPSACALVAGGTAPALAVLEAAAQTAAVWEALRRGRSGGAPGPRQGYLVSLRDVTFHRARVPAERAVIASVRLEAVAMPLTHYRTEVALDGETIMHGTIATVLA